MLAALTDVAGEHQPWCGGALIAAEGDTWLNLATHVGITDHHNDTPTPITANDIQTAADWYRARGKKSFKLELSAYAHESVFEAVNNAGMAFKDIENVLIHTLHDTPDRPTPPERITITHHHRPNHDTALAIAGFTSSTFSKTDEPIPEELAINLRCLAHQRMHYVTAHDNDTLVGAAGIEIYEDWACLFFGCVHPPARNKGIQTELIHQRLDIARNHNLRYALVSGIPGGPTERNAIRAGFTPLTTRIAFTMDLTQDPHNQPKLGTPNP